MAFFSEPHPSEDESTSLIVKQSAVEPVESVERCKVCDRFTMSTHYGVAVCGGCACMLLRRCTFFENAALAFFRRTVASGKSYKCTCRMPFRNKKKGASRQFEPRFPSKSRFSSFFKDLKDFFLSHLGKLSNLLPSYGFEKLFLFPAERGRNFPHLTADP